ncbi:unnamed protein product [Orchesella dallaii]|uniref:CUB domain-containing protein n=1 Tax=Orchesella dallaii TaxID=48710 RepID=A0ABP1S9M8_9HEXA
MFLGTNDIQTIEESLLIIVFQSDFSNRGIGFSLAFSSSGNNSNPDYSFNLLHISEPNGTIEYPYPSSIWKTSGIKNKPLSIIAYSLNQGTEEESFFSVAMRLSWKHGVFRRANQHCEYDTVTIYTAPKISGWNLVSRFPTVNDTSNCPDIVTVMAKELRTSMYPTFLAVFKPVASDEIAKEKDEATSFAFTYENGGCGGVYVEDSGVIRYKDDGKYANDEECIWLIHVPFAESISFELEHGMFEAKADYISVSSVKPFIGVENETIVISSENRKATVKGPLTVVTFTSDRSNYRYGFRLYFRMEKRMTETDDPMVAFKLFHQNRRFQNEFAYHAEPNQIAIIAFSSGIRRAGRNRIDVTYFLPQVNESCSSDSLLVYDVYGRVGRTIVLTKNFTAEVSNVEETHMDGSTVVRRCTALVNRQLQTCINNETCHAPVGGSFRTKSSSFLAIYSIAV